MAHSVLPTRMCRQQAPRRNTVTVRVGTMPICCSRSLVTPAITAWSCVFKSFNVISFGGALGSRTLSAARHHRGISNPVPYHPAHAPLYYYIVNVLTRQQRLVETAGVEPAVPEAADLQSTGVTNFPTSPIWWTEGESNSQLRLAKPLCSQLYQQPKFFGDPEWI